MQQQLDPRFEHHHQDRYIPHFYFLAKSRIRSELAFTLFTLLYSVKEKSVIIVPMCVCNDSLHPKILNKNLLLKFRE